VLAAAVVDGMVNEGEEGEPPKPQVVKRGRGRPKGSTSKKPSAKAKAAKGKEKATNDTGDEHQQAEQEEAKSPVEPEERETADTTETGAGESVAKGGQEEKAKKEEPEYFYEPDYVDINALWVAICEHWQRYPFPACLHPFPACRRLTEMFLWCRDCASISDPISNELVLMTLGTCSSVAAVFVSVRFLPV
jgi:hypothetical protein